MGLEEMLSNVKTRFADVTEKSSVLIKQGTEKSAEFIENLIPAAIEMFKCPRCLESTPHNEYVEADKVCKCGYHGRMTAYERLAVTADKNSFYEFDKNMTSKNPIDFPKYEEKISDLQKKTGLSDAVLTGECTIHGNKTVIGIMDSNFMMGSMGSVVGEKLTRAFEYATANNLPIVLFCASGGARMQEGIVSLMQMAKTSGAAARHSDKKLLFVSVITDPTTGGVTASFASLGDIIIAEPRVVIGFAGRRVIQGTIKQHLPDDFQTAEMMLSKGFVDMLVTRRKMRETLADILGMHA